MTKFIKICFYDYKNYHTLEILGIIFIITTIQMVFITSLATTFQFLLSAKILNPIKRSPSYKDCCQHIIKKRQTYQVKTLLVNHVKSFIGWCKNCQRCSHCQLIWEVRVVIPNQVIELGQLASLLLFEEYLNHYYLLFIICKSCR